MTTTPAAEPAKEGKEERNDPLAGPTLHPETGALMRTSPSQNKTFQSCPRKWWYEKIAKLARKPPSKGQQIGTRGHKLIENLLIYGVDQRGPLELSGDHMLRPYMHLAPFHWAKEHFNNCKSKKDLEALVAWARQQTPLKVEESINEGLASPLRTPGGVLFIGYSDLMLAPGVFDRIGNAGGRTAHSLDHKFKKDLEAYADKEDELRSDPQKVVYGFALIQRWPETEEVHFAHHNHQTEGRREAWARGVVTPVEEVRSEFASLCAVVDGPMREASTKTRDLDVEPNETQCKKFGGCDFLTVCPNSPRNKFLVSIPGVTRPGITIEGKKMGLLDMASDAMKANAAQAPATGGAPASTVTAPPAVSSRVAASAGVAGQLYMTAQGVGKFHSSAADGFAYLQKPDQSYFKIPNTEGMESVQNDPVARQNFGLPPLTPPAAVAPPPVAPPPVAPPPVAPPPVAPPPAVEEKPARRMLIIDVPATGAGAAINPPGAASIPPTPSPEAQEAQKNALAAQQAAALGTVPPPAVVVNNVVTPPAVTTPPAATTPPPASEPAKKPRGRPRKGVEAIANGSAQAATTGGISGLILVVNSSVFADQVTDLSGYVADLAASVAAAAGAPDVRFADPKGPLGYGGWRGAMAAAALKSPPSGVCAISSGDLADPVIEALAPLAEVLIRGR